MIAMMLPAAMPLILLYGASVRRAGAPRNAGFAMTALLAGYIALWTAAGIPVYAYSRIEASVLPLRTVLPALLLLLGGVHQFSRLKQRCHARCTSPLFFLSRHWRPGMLGAVQLGLRHGVDCIGCCAGVMLALVALGMMNVGWMVAATVVITAEKTLPGGHMLARPAGAVLMGGGVYLLITTLGSGA